MTDRHCIVLAGGLGTRLLPVTGGLIPKALVPVLGRPFLEYKLASLASMGVTSVSIMIGELGFMIEEYIWSSPPLRLDVQCLQDGDQLLGTGGAIAKWSARLPEEFWITYGDSLVVADLDRAETCCRTQEYAGVMTVLRNRDFLQTSNTSVVGDTVIEYDKSSKQGLHEWIDYGLLMLRREHFTVVQSGDEVDLSSVFTPLISNRALMAWEATERFWDVGTPEALAETENELRRRLST